MRDNAPDDGESRRNTSMPLVVEASRSITSPAPVPQAKRHLFPVLASQQAQRISALVRYDAVGAEEDEEAAMHRTRTILPLPLLSWLTVASCPTASGPDTAQRARLCEARVSDAEVRTIVKRGLM